MTLLVTAANKAESVRLQAATRRYTIQGVAGGNRLVAQFLKNNDPKRNFTKWDKNKDGKLQRSEMPFLLRRRYFDQFDIDGDGALGKDEVE